jgi:CubicO group peptidase (beta-lactamase class C family)
VPESLCAVPCGRKCRANDPAYRTIDAQARRIMAPTHANGLAIAIIDHGRVSYLHAYGIRNAKGDPLTKSTVMYGASLTKQCSHTR